MACIPLAVAEEVEQYEIATIKAVGNPGTQAYLAADVPVGSTNIKVTSVADVSVGDKIRLDIDSVDHGIETVVVKHVGTPASRTNLSAIAPKGATNVKVRNTEGFKEGDELTIGTPSTFEIVIIANVGGSGATGSGITLNRPKRTTPINRGVKCFWSLTSDPRNLRQLGRHPVR